MGELYDIVLAYMRQRWPRTYHVLEIREYTARVICVLGPTTPIWVEHDPDGIRTSDERKINKIYNPTPIIHCSIMDELEEQLDNILRMDIKNNYLGLSGVHSHFHMRYGVNGLGSLELIITIGKYEFRSEICGGKHSRFIKQLDRLLIDESIRRNISVIHIERILPQPIAEEILEHY